MKRGCLKSQIDFETTFSLYLISWGFTPNPSHFFCLNKKVTKKIQERIKRDQRVEFIQGSVATSFCVSLLPTGGHLNPIAIGSSRPSREGSGEPVGESLRIFSRLQCVSAVILIRTFETACFYTLRKMRFLY